MKAAARILFVAVAVLAAGCASAYGPTAEPTPEPMADLPAVTAEAGDPRVGLSAGWTDAGERKQRGKRSERSFSSG